MTQPTMLLVHGAFANSFSFAPLQAELALHGVRSAAVDLPGHGYAATIPAGYQSPQDLAEFTSAPGSIRGVTLADNVAHLAEAATRAKQHGPVIVLAHSRGGVTPDNPYQVRTLVSSHLGWMIRPVEAAVALAQIVAEVAAQSD